MKIKNEKQARELLKAIGDWLRSDLPNDKKRNSLDSDTKQACIAREFATELLEAVSVDDLGGCPLCCS